MTRKGISFTLTLVVIGVVLLMTALTVIVLGGGEIGGFLQRGGESSLESSVSSACGQLASAVNNNYCSYYAAGSDASSADCADVDPNPDSQHSVPATNAGCTWTAPDGTGTGDSPGGAQGDLTSVLDKQAQGAPGVGAWVQVQGDWYNCVQEGRLTPQCPA